ncbi:hypothetical protein [Streptomyces sp. 8L]|uniref:hypothetical protein n=1 Tax=Streptomyces sp. 8L TaxID=2877242 RepID=UPI001CD76DDD|nr:hypothetical protein [Streptomyces sp. 8L]MCA1222358.1 hypothetical protein [Streptomyces sp. 8L]
MDVTTDSPPLALAELTDGQRRGGVCAYCGTPVSNRTAVDLGTRLDADGIRIFPRAHPDCVEVAR